MRNVTYIIGILLPTLIIFLWAFLLYNKLVSGIVNVIILIALGASLIVEEIIRHHHMKRKRIL
jgi:general stress protein CsbA